VVAASEKPVAVKPTAPLPARETAPKPAPAEDTGAIIQKINDDYRVYMADIDAQLDALMRNRTDAENKLIAARQQKDQIERGFSEQRVSQFSDGTRRSTGVRTSQADRDKALASINAQIAQLESYIASIPQAQRDVMTKSDEIKRAYDKALREVRDR